jgi:hypothetical protein
VDLVISTGEFWQFLINSVSSWKHEVVASAASSPVPVDVGASASSSSSTAAAGSSNNDDFCSPEYLRAYFVRLPLDNELGSDSIEALFRCFSNISNDVVAAADANAGSGAYTEYLFRYAAEQIYGVAIPLSFPLQYKVGRNEDIAEIDIADVLNQLAHDAVHGASFAAVAAAATASRKLKFGRAYGFRNIQSIITKLRRGACDLDFIELMACPSGCNNGGGQIKGDAKQESLQQHVESSLGTASKEESSVTAQQLGKKRIEAVVCSFFFCFFVLHSYKGINAMAVFF